MLEFDLNFKMMALVVYSKEGILGSAQMSMVANAAGLKLEYREPSELFLKGILLPWPGNGITTKLEMQFLYNKGIFPPVLEAAEGFVIGVWPIEKYVGRQVPELGLCGSSPFEDAAIDFYFDFCRNEIEPFCNPTEVLRSVDDRLYQLLSALNDLLLYRTFLVGDRLTIADIHVATALKFLISSESINLNISTLPNVSRLLNTVMALDSKVLDHKSERFQKISGEPLIIKNDNLNGYIKEFGFSMDMWKREYSNSKDIVASIAYFWENFDSENWSIFHVVYNKLDGECTSLCITSNQLTGFLQRFESQFRQISFGVFLVLGEASCFDIKGVLVVKGKDIPDLLKMHPSFEFYAFIKLNAKDESHKKLINDYLIAGRVDDCFIEGIPMAVRKVWK